MLNPPKTIMLFMTGLLVSLGLCAGDEQVVWEGQLRKKSKSIKGSVSLVVDGDQTLIKFSENFRTKAGPDLKVVLSPQSFKAVNGKNAMKNATLVALLKKTSGSQTYTLPAGIDWKQFKSLLVHCEKYAVLWGGASLEK